MTHPLRRKKVEGSIEKQILTAMIVSTQFLSEVQHLVNYDYFQNNYIRTVVQWCFDHYKKYEVAPFEDISSIFKVKQADLAEEDAELIEKLLTDVSNKYALNIGINVPYTIDLALQFFKKRELEITSSNIRILLDRNDIDGAEDEINNFAKISKIASGWIDPFNEQYVDELFSQSERMFNFPGTLGKFLGGLDRGWLVAIAGGYKFGKSWNLQEIAIHAIQQRLRVVWFSLEMGRKESNDRLYKRLLGAGSADGGLALYPCFDCKHNQDNSCSKPQRANRYPLLSSGSKPPFRSDLKYRPCTACRFSDRASYDPAWWFELIDRPAYVERNIKTQIQAVKRAWPNMYRFKQYPKFSATLSDMRRDLDILERTEGFVPDVIIVDQANGVKPETGISLDGIAPHAATWRGLASLAGERHSLVVSPTQITRAALSKKSVKQSDVAQWIGLVGDIDVGYALNQTDEEKKEGVMRYSIMAHRHDDFNADDYCIVLQKIRFGQVYLDAEVISKRVSKDEYTL